MLIRQNDIENYQEETANTHTKTGTNRKEWRSQWRSYRQNQQMTLKSVPTSGRSKVTSCIVITMNPEFNPTCRRKEHSQTQWIHWCYEVYSYWSGCVAKEKDWQLLKFRFKQTFVRFLERIHKIHSTERKNLFMYGQKFGQTLIKSLRIENNRNAKETDIQASRKRAQSRRWDMKRSSKKCVITMWNLLNVRDNEQNLCSLKKTWRSHCKWRMYFQYTLQCCAEIYSDATSDEDSGCQKLPLTRNGRSSRQFQHGFWKNQEQEGGYSGSTKRCKESPLCYTGGHMSPKKMRS